MNILFYSTKSGYTARKIGGAETSMRLMAESLAGAGCTVTYATTSETRCWRWESRLCDGVKVVLIPSFRNGLFAALPLWITSRMDRLAGRLRALKHRIDFTDIDVVYLYYQLRPALWFADQQQNYGFSVVMRMAGLDWYEDIRQKPQRKQLYEQLFQSVASINYNSYGLQRLCESRAAELGLNLKPRDLFVHDIGVREAAQKHQTRSAFENGQLSVIVATRFSSYQKRQDILVHAVKILKNTGVVTRNNFNLLFIGSGDRQTEIQSLIQDLNLQDVCTIIPFMQQQDVWKKLEQADLLCHPCEYEGLAKIVAESMIMGLPVLVSKVEPFTDIISHGETGFLTENTPESWAESLSGLLVSSDARKYVSARSRTYALEHYNPKRNARIYLQEFMRINGGI